MNSGFKSQDSSLPDDVVLRVDNVSKKFCRNLKRSMAYGMHDLGRNLLGLRSQTINEGRQILGPEIENQAPSTRHQEPAKIADGLRTDEFWALQNISFELRRGECLGLIGPNGCGKSTLLRLIAGIFPPDRGEITIRGRVGALIALGAGFHPNMSGRENIRLNGAILGMSSQEVESKFDEIVDFAEIGDFLDAPVSTYSSGMRVRLGFAIAVAVTPELLLVDEVLAVGDVGFRTKCINRINSILPDTAVIFVSHSVPLVSRTVSRVQVMDSGLVAYSGTDIGLGIEMYLDRIGGTTAVVTGSGKVRLLRAQVVSPRVPRATVDAPTATPVFEHGEELQLELDVEADESVAEYSIVVIITDRSQEHIASVYSRADDFFVRNDGRTKTVVTTFANLFGQGDYLLNIAIVERTEDRNKPGEVYALHIGATKFKSGIGRVISHVPVQFAGKWHLEEFRGNGGTAQ
jgi:lipopolysaccharide transport system ATP-binding protein